MAKLQVFDPAMCCSTGVCGPRVDPTLPRFAADLEWLKSKGFEVERFNLAQQVASFTSNGKVKQALNSQGTQVLPNQPLPIVMINASAAAVVCPTSLRRFGVYCLSCEIANSLEFSSWHWQKRLRFMKRSNCNKT